MIEFSTDGQISREEQEAERFSDMPEDSVVTNPEQEFRDASMRVIIQRNDFLLPALIDMLTTHRTLEVSPYYQRRARWDIKRKSRLIESFLVNIPVPPVFLYENEFARYEVMDGQQRVSAILEFFQNKFSLRGLEILNGLHGLRFDELPKEVKAGLERRSLAAVILLKESTPSHDSAILLRRYVFERLNTGGVRLNAQEVRNSVYTGPFNDLIIKLSRAPLFTSMWDIPALEPNGSSEPTAKLLRNVLYKQMGDVELVLRVFALLDPTNIARGMKSTLDNAMKKYSSATDSELRELRTQFLSALELAHAIGGYSAFRLPVPGTRRGRSSASLYDGVMVALIRKLDQAPRIRAQAEQINQAIHAELENSEFRKLVAGRANTRKATLNRALYIERLIESAIVESQHR